MSCRCWFTQPYFLAWALIYMAVFTKDLYTQLCVAEIELPETFRVCANRRKVLKDCVVQKDAG